MLFRSVEILRGNKQPKKIVESVEVRKKESPLEVVKRLQSSGNGFPGFTVSLRRPVQNHLGHLYDLGSFSRQGPRLLGVGACGGHGGKVEECRD